MLSRVMMPMYCITLDETPERQEACKRHFAERNLAVTIWKGIHGKTWGLDTTIRYHLEKPDEPYKITPGMSALIINHWMLWQHLLIAGHEEAMIFEDDVLLPPRFGDYLEEMMSRVPADWQVVYVGHKGGPQEENKITRHIAPGIVQMNYPFCTHAYAVRRSALPVLMKTCALLRKPLDVAMGEWSLPRLRHYAFWPVAVKQGSILGKCQSTLH